MSGRTRMEVISFVKNVTVEAVDAENVLVSKKEPH